jgi:hypothetical protein
MAVYDLRLDPDGDDGLLLAAVAETNDFGLRWPR